MADVTLGLDLGSNSVGWALVDEAAHRIAAAGVRVFPEGIARDQSGREVSKGEARRLARQARRQILRRARRKRRLRAILVKAGLLPAGTPAEWWSRQDPYLLRSRAVDERLEPHEIGRVLVHLNQRRGFRPSSRADRRQKPSELKGMLGEISTLAGELDAAGQTLGQYLARLREDPHQRVRGRHTRRDMFEIEFDRIWAVQQAHHPELLSDALRERIRKTIFYQRPLRIPRSVIGTCELEPKRRRCPRADRLAQRFRMLQQVNDLRMIDAHGQERALTERERCRLLELLGRKKELKFDAIRKALDLLDGTVFNYERGEREKLDGMATDHALASTKVFGKRWWELPENVKDAVVRSLLDEEDSVVRRRAKEEWGLDQEATERLLRVDLQAGYVRFSRDALLKLVPHMEKGLPLMGPDDQASALSEAGYLRPDQRGSDTRSELPQPPEVGNPIVRQALHEVRKVVNAICREYGKPARIHIELARDVKGSAEQRYRRTLEIRDRRRQREQAAEAIREAGQSPTRHFVDRYLLWQEQRKVCIYSGRAISLAQLLGGEVDVDHILPYPRSLDDSLANKVICFREVNAAKQDQTPYEWLAEREPTRYEQVLQRARSLPYPKYRRFIEKTVELKDFVHRQLTDTAYISRQVRDYVRHLGVDVVCTKGQHTAELRHQWGLNTVLDPQGSGEKNRADHRHHAIDAITVALTDRSRLQQMASGWRGGRLTVADPWDGFRDQVAQCVQGIVVSHRVQRKVRGQLHNEKIYGATSIAGMYVRRKPIKELTDTKHLAKVRDDVVRETLRDHVRRHGIDPDTPGAIPPVVWGTPPRMKKRGGGEGPPIKKVRMVEESTTFRQIRGRAYIKPDSNHHIAYFERPDGSWRAAAVTRLDAASRVRSSEPVVNRSCANERFLMSFSIGECLIINDGGQERTCVVRMIDQRSQRLHYKYHFDGRPTPQIKKDNLYASPSKLQTMQARKVTIDVLGRIRRAND